jgi:2-oxoglutarate dehydrogenase E1 component
MKSIEQHQNNSYLYGGNVDFIEELYEKYLDNPNSVDTKWREYFNTLQVYNKNDVIHSSIKDKFSYITSNNIKNHLGVSSGGEFNNLQLKVFELINTYREIGVEKANLDPLQRIAPEKIDRLDVEKLGLADSLDDDFYIDVNLLDKKKSLRKIIETFEQIYCNTIGFEYSHITNQIEKNWLKDNIENKLLDFTLTTEEKKDVLAKLTEAEGIEKFLNTKFVGQKRFSLEGGDSLIPALDRIINNFALNNVKKLFIGMAHRGRLNVLVNINGKSPEKLFAEFNGDYELGDFVTNGDVKYHKGYSCDYQTNNGSVEVRTLFNPSHLEIVNPVLNGIVRSYQDKTLIPQEIAGVIIHGDSALIGLGTNQGVLNMSNTRSYGVHGLIHIVINNQVGFTTSDVRDTRSSRFCTDIFKMTEVPIIHLNADDLDKVIFAIDLAIEYKIKFNKDIVIDLVCFRRHGHNEADDPTLTQPLMYRKVKSHPGIRKLYAEQLLSDKVITENYADELIEDYRNYLSQGIHPRAKKMLPLQIYDEKLITKLKSAKIFDQIKTSIILEDLVSITNLVTTIPTNIKLHPTIMRTVIEPRRKMLTGEVGIDFGMAETLAYASLLQEGYSVRICGEDSGRGTFSHRHAVWHNFERNDITDSGYIPLKQFEKNSLFSIYDSVLNEECALGFEYGYSLNNLSGLVIWEAQFGDFANGAQVIIDQFIASGESKWGVISGITLMLPHGYDGQGPEHSSARIERFLQLSAENNIQVVIPSSAAQMFHFIRRRVFDKQIKPAVIFMSKRLLRLKEATSNIADITSGYFSFVIYDKTISNNSNVKKVIVCSGQIYYDLVAYRNKLNLNDSVAIVRLEQIYPFPFEQLKSVINLYNKANNFIWVQEEPYNQGSWIQIRDYLDLILTNNKKFEVVSRDASASPACGLMKDHMKQLEQILERSFR